MIDSVYIDALQIHNTGTYFLTQVTGLEGSPGPRQNRTDKAQRHGQNDYTKFYTGRPIGLHGVAIGANVLAAYAALDKLKGAFALGSTHLFKFLRTGFTESEQCLVKVDSTLDVSLDIPRAVIEWGVTLVAADPRIYTTTVRSGSYDPSLAGSGGGGMVMPMTVVGGLVFSTSTTTHLVSANNGNFPAPVTFTIIGPVNNPVIDNDSLAPGNSIYIIYNLGTSDIVTVNTLDRSVLLNGYSRPDLLDVQNTTWFDLAPGQNNLRLRGNAMVTAKTLLTATYQDARI